MRRNEDRYPTRRSTGFGISPWSEPDLFGSSSMFGGSPWQAMRRMQEDMDRLFGSIVGQAGPSGSGSQQGGAPAQSGSQTGMQSWAPNVDISESPREWCIEAELPGVSKDQIEVQLHDHHLILSAEMRQDSEAPRDGRGNDQQQRQYHRRERRYGFFQRVIPLPESANEEQIACDFQNGVLTIHVPKARQAQHQPRRIPVQDMVEQIPSETASGRLRSEAELEMTEDEDEHAMAGAKGGETGKSTSGKSSSGTNAARKSSGSTDRSSGKGKIGKTHETGS